MNVVLVALWIGAAVLAAAPIQAAKTFNLNQRPGLKAHNVEIEPVAYKGKNGLRVTEPAGQSREREDRLVVVEGSELADGTIDLEVAGRPGAGAAEAARGFVGLAFHVAADLSSFECFYLRPTNGRADDQLRRNHSAQYVSFPDFPWHRLRKET